MWVGRGYQAKKEKKIALGIKRKAPERRFAFLVKDLGAQGVALLILSFLPTFFYCCCSSNDPRQPMIRASQIHVHAPSLAKVKNKITYGVL